LHNPGPGSLALAYIDEKQMGDYVMSVLAYPAAARLALHHGELSEAQARLVQGMRARPQVTYVFPFIAVHLRLEMAKVPIALSNTAAARQLLRETDDIFARRPTLGSLVDDTEALRTALPGTQTSGPSPLTAAELRLLPYLQTHLTARDIGHACSCRLTPSTPRFPPFIASWACRHAATP
jgi:LuxR family transcriptional regulator, maltose regulon positive regulatory protein